VLDHDVTWPLPEAPTRFDYVMHAAGIASPTRYRASPLEAVDATVGGVRNLLERGRELAESNAGMRALLYFSSSEVYGDPLADNIPTPETYHGNVSCLGPRACYDESKRLGETLCAIFSRSYGVPAKIVRPFNNYGPGQRLDDGRVLSDFAGDVLDSRDIVVLSDGRPTRTFCYVADAVIGYYRALVRGRPGEAYNIGMDGPEISIDEVAERVATAARDLFAYRGRVVRGQPTDADYLVDTPQRRCPDITKARIELGFAPSIGLDDGLRRALTWWADVRARVAV